MDKYQQYDQILKALRASRFVSGSALGARLSLSRTAINRRIAELQDMGTPINAVVGKGYHLDDSVTLLRDHYAELPEDLHFARHIITQSTNDDVATRAAMHPAPCLITTEYQQVGRGRRGNTWLGALGRDIAVSIGFPLDGVDSIPPYSLVTGVLVATVVRDVVGVTDVGLKWPNDLWVGDAKLGGILTELHTFKGVPYVVIGVGVNVNQSAAAIEGRPIASLRQLVGRPIDRDALLINIAKPLCGLIRGEGVSDWHDRWQEFDLLAGRLVSLNQGDRERSGHCEGIDASGHLLIDSGEGVAAYAGGVANVRPH